MSGGEQGRVLAGVEQRAHLRVARLRLRVVLAAHEFLLDAVHAALRKLISGRIALLATRLRAMVFDRELSPEEMQRVKEHLDTKYGIVLQQPAFSKYYLHLGESSSYPPGYKENAGIFCHTNPWIMIAEAMAGHGGACQGRGGAPGEREPHPAQ